MDFRTFKEGLDRLGCFHSSQIYLRWKDFDRNNLTRWVKKGYLLRLRRDFYVFPEFAVSRDAAFYCANQMYAPSYISLHTALSFYGMIPESVIQVTSITSLKTMFFENQVGEFSYKKVKPSLMFGFEPKMIDKERSILFATPEKALLDLLYLYPFYKTEKDFEELRLDEDFMQDDLDVSRMDAYLEQFDSKSLTSRVALMKKVYEV